MKQWENINCDGIGRLNARAHFFSFPNRDRALLGENRYTHNFKNLNGKWKFLFLEAPEYSPEGFYTNHFKTDYWDDIIVPSNWQICGYGDVKCNNLLYAFPINPPYVPTENPTGIYRRDFSIDKNWTGKKIILRLNGIDSSYNLWINGQEVGYSKGARIQSEFDITKYVIVGVNNITIRVYQWSDGTYLENHNIWCLSGIFRDVELYTEPKNGIDDITIITDLDNDNRDVNLNIKLNFRTLESKEVIFELIDNNRNSVFKEICDVSGETFEFNKCVINPLKWSAEEPNLYTLLITMSKYGEIIQVVPKKIGFRKIELVKEIFRVNGVAIKLKGVNRYDFNPNNGRVVTREEIIEDIILMKKHNINAIKTTHYPNSYYFYDICDEYGMYVIEEADLICHGVEYEDNYKWILDDSKWELAYTSRLERMIHRDKNHPSILMWSLGNGALSGHNMKKIYKKVKELDITRLIHYECSIYPSTEKEKVSDVYSSMYSWIESDNGGTLDKILKEIKMPYIHCEYGNAMANGPGNLKEYHDIYYSNEKFQGGFIWNWGYGGIESLNKNGKDFYKSYRDFDNEVCCINGLVFLDKTPSPALLEYKKALEPVQMEAINIEKGLFKLINRYDFKNLNTLDLIYNIVEDEKIIKSGRFQIPSVPGRGSKIIQLPYSIDFEPLCGASYYLNISFILNESYIWAKVGYEVAATQFILPIAKKKLEIFPTGSLQVKKDGYKLIASGEDFSISFDLVKGHILEVCKNGQKIVEDGPKLNFWRAPISNDRYLIEEYKKKYLIHLMNEIVEDISYTVNERILCLKVNVINGCPNSSWYYKCTYEYNICSSGDILVNIYGKPSGVIKNAPEMIPRIGVKLKINKDYDNVKWKGKGPRGSYIDSNEANLYGIYKNSVEGLFTNYIKPQENGNRHNCEWVSLINDRGLGILAVAKEKFDFSALYYEVSDLENAKHYIDLKKREYIVFNIDYMQNGLGSNLCGQDHLDKYKCKFKEFNLSFKMIMYNNKEISDVSLAREFIIIK